MCHSNDMSHFEQSYFHLGMESNKKMKNISILATQNYDDRQIRLPPFWAESEN